MVQLLQTPQQDNGIGGAIAQSLQGLAQGGVAGLQLGMALRKAQAVEQYQRDQQALAEKQQQHQEAVDGVKAWGQIASLPPSLRGPAAKMLLPDLGFSDEAIAGMTPFLKDETMGPAFAGAAAELGMGQGQQNLLAYYANNGMWSQASDLINTTIASQSKQQEAAALQNYRQQSLGLQSRGLDIQQQNADANTARAGQPAYQGSPVLDADGRPWVMQKPAGGGTPRMVPLDQGDGAPSAPSAPGGGLRMPSEAEVASFKSALARGADPAAMLQHAREQGYDPSGFGGEPSSPAAPSAASSGGGFKPAPKPLTEAQSKDTYFLGNMEQGDKGISGFLQANADYLDSPEAKSDWRWLRASDNAGKIGAGLGGAVGGVAGLLGGIPGVAAGASVGGGLGYAAGEAMAPDVKRQISDQAKEYLAAATPFVTSVLHKETGAAISAAEWDQAFQQYLPEPGDTAKQLLTKAANRAKAIEGVRKGLGK